MPPAHSITLFLKGIERKSIFKDDRDYSNFLGRLGKVLTDPSFHERPSFANIMKTLILLFVFIISFIIGCAESNGDEKLLKEFAASNDTDKMLELSNKIVSKGEDGIPILLDVLSMSLENPFLLNNYARINICIKSLYTLAKNNVFILEEVPILIKALHNQMYMPDTYLTAETLRMITGIDTGYSEEFVNSYTEEDEPITLSKIKEWEKWWEVNKPDERPE